jgi:dTDP-glucose 4,6-dehydratase
MGSNKFDYIINFAAETHVDRSVKNSEDFVMTNNVGTRVLLDATKKYGIEKFVQIGTDEVYGSLDKNSPSSKETDATKPSSPYSASKLGADALALSYFYTHGVPVCVTRSSNNYGPWQFPEKVIPLFITNILDGKKVPVYGDGQNIRDWIHVSDNCRGIAWVMERGKPGEIYNIGGGNELTNLDLTERILREMGFGDDWKKQIEFVEDRKGHDKRYSLDSNKIQESPFGPNPLMPFGIGLQGTIDWYKQNEKWWRRLKK